MGEDASSTREVVGDAVPVRDRQARGVRLAYGFGAVAFGIKDCSFNFFLMMFYNQVIGLPAGLVGTALMLALISDALLDPLIGHLSDGLRTRWGRRHPFMYASAVPATIAFICLWMPQASWSHQEQFAYLFITTLALRAFISLYEIPGQALGAELSPDYDERTALFSLRSLFGWLGALGAAFMAFAVFLRPDADHPVGQLNPAGYAKFGVTGGIMILVAILVSALGTHRQIPSLGVASGRERLGIVASLRGGLATLSHYSFLMLLLASLFASMALGLHGGLGVYFNTYYWRLSSDQLAILVLALLPAALLGTALPPMLSRHIEKKVGAIIFSLSAMALGIAPLVLRLVGFFPGNNTPALLPLLFAFTMLSTAAIIAALVLIPSMMADVAEDNATATGKRSEGIFFAANFFIQKCVSGVGIFLIGLILSWVAFPQKAAPGAVPESVLLHLALVQVGVHAVLFLCAAFFFGRYRLDRASHEASRARRSLDDEESPQDGAPMPTAQPTPSPGALATMVGSSTAGQIL